MTRKHKIISSLAGLLAIAIVAAATLPWHATNTNYSSSADYVDSIDTTALNWEVISEIRTPGTFKSSLFGSCYFTSDGEDPCYSVGATYTLQGEDLNLDQVKQEITKFLQVNNLNQYTLNEITCYTGASMCSVQVNDNGTAMSIRGATAESIYSDSRDTATVRLRATSVDIF